jgi:ACS family tartrate transporter-like MFS transporter
VRSQPVEIRARIARRILPFVFILYIVCYIDRAAVSFANQAMSSDLHFSEEVFGFGAGIFFVGYFLLEIPGTLIVERWSARLWIARIAITWGLVTILAGFVRSPHQFYGARFLLGAAEAGFFPGIIVYLTHWFPVGDRARALAGFTIAAPVALTVGAPLSAMILSLRWPGIQSWRALFVLEGIPAIIMGVLTLFYLTDRPRDAKWLNADERDWLETELRTESRKKRTGPAMRWWQAFYRRDVLLLTAAAFWANVSGYAFVLWLPRTIGNLGISSTRSVVLSAIPYLVGIIAALLVGRSADRRGGRKWHACGCFLIGCVSLVLFSIPGQPVLLSLLWISLTGTAAYGYLPAFWVLPTLLLGETAAAASIGLINSVGNLGGFAGPWVLGAMLQRQGGNRIVMLFPAGCYMLSAIFTSLVRPPSAAQPDL